MNSEHIQLIGLGLLLLAEQYMVAPWQFPVFAVIWDVIARIAWRASVIFDRIAMRARINYYSAVNVSG